MGNEKRIQLPSTKVSSHTVYNLNRIALETKEKNFQIVDRLVEEEAIKLRLIKKTKK